ncbi:MAG: hydantoinase/oxoprolinase family protein [Gemmatimonadales bacterium]|jgi:(4-(4-[2-(gamma-L-glutamylamino)ethyl]phenoxymethyl)furan-2-yl)methanamine synthase
MTSAESARGAVLGWDIGGVNTKAVLAMPRDGGAPSLMPAVTAFEIQRDPSALGAVLTALADRLGRRGRAVHAVTMTAELSQAFRTKREGVGFVLDAVAAAFPAEEVRVFTTDASFVSPAAARARPWDVGASNWVATATLLSRFVSDALLVDIGSTSTDIIPIVAGQVAARGRTDPARLLSGELVYTGTVRTPAEALVREVPLWDGCALVSAEGFATVGDAHVWLARLTPSQYTAPTADGRPATREYAGERLARLVCGDREMVASAEIDRIARAIAEAQLDLVGAGIRRVWATAPAANTAVVTGLGAFIATEAARREGLEPVPLARWLGEAAEVAPAAAAAWLLAEELAQR